MRSTFTRRAAVLVAVIAPVIVAMASATPVAAVELSQRCTNPDEGYSVNLPRGWYYNETVEADGTDDVAACRFFSPDDFEVRPASGIADVAIGIGREATAPRAEGEATTVGGKPATIVEVEAGDDSFDPAGTRYYQYWIDIGAEWLVATTSDGPAWVGSYEDNKDVLDAMMGTLASARRACRIPRSRSRGVRGRSPPAGRSCCWPRLAPSAWRGAPPECTEWAGDRTGRLPESLPTGVIA